MDWNEFNTLEQAKPYYNNLYDFVKTEYDKNTCFPPFDLILNAMGLTPYDKVKCVIIGQDPYHRRGQAMGLSFSVPENVTVPPSLKNIYQEIHDELGCYIPNHGNLTKWAKQGVLLLNSVLTVRENQAFSHANRGWEQYTDNAIMALNQKTTPVVYMLWGNAARAKKSLISNPEHLILESPHPSPFSAARGFFGNNHFKLCNDYLQSKNIEPIDWQIENI